MLPVHKLKSVNSDILLTNKSESSANSRIHFAESVDDIIGLLGFAGD